MHSMWVVDLDKSSNAYEPQPPMAQLQSHMILGKGEIRKHLPDFARDHQPLQWGSSYFINSHHIPFAWISPSFDPLAWLAWQTPALCEGQRRPEAPGYAGDAVPTVPAAVPSSTG